MYVRTYDVCMHEFPNDNKQEILVLKLFNIFCWCIYQQNFPITTSKRSIFKIGSSESIYRILEKYLQRNLHFRKLFYMYEQNPRNTPVMEFFFFFSVFSGFFLPYSCRIVINANITKKWHEGLLKARRRRKTFCI